MAKGDIKIAILTDSNLYSGDWQIVAPAKFIDKIIAALKKAQKLEDGIDYRCSAAGKTAQGDLVKTLIFSPQQLETALLDAYEVKTKIWADAVQTDTKGKLIKDECPYLR